MFVIKYIVNKGMKIASFEMVRAKKKFFLLKVLFFCNYIIDDVIIIYSNAFQLRRVAFVVSIRYVLENSITI